MNSLELGPNPFRTTVVADPWQPPEADVPEIHAEACDLCLRGVEYVRTQRKSASILLFGEAGSGKTHVMGRLRAQLAESWPWIGTQYDPAAVFVSVRLQSSPQMLWRHLRRRMADDLLRPRGPDCYPLKRILVHRLGELCDIFSHRHMWWECTQGIYPDVDDLDRFLAPAFERLEQDAELGRELSLVLAHLLLDRHCREARDWLRGDPLPEAALERLGLAEADEAAEEQEDRARRMVLALCRLAGPELPLVFCFDQLEALQLHPQDTLGLFTFGKLISALHDETSNALLISCIQSSFQDLMNDAIRGAHRDRMADFGKTALNPLTFEQARQLVVTRLNSRPVVSARPDLAGWERRLDPLWPLDEAALRTVVGNQGCSARAVVARCDQLFEAARGTAEPAPPNSLDVCLSSGWQARFKSALESNTAAGTDAIIQHGLPILVDLAAPGWKHHDLIPPWLDLLFECEEGRVGVCLCNQRMKSLEAKLRHLKALLHDARLEKVVLLRDPRLEIGKNAKASRKHLEELAQQDVHLFQPSVTHLAALDALRVLVSDSSAGDLAQNGATIQPGTLRTWLASHLPNPLQQLLTDLLSPPICAPPDASESPLRIHSSAPEKSR